MSLELIPVNSLRRHTKDIEDVLIGAASEVIRSGYFVLGPSVKQFEQKFAQYCGVAHCISLANGTDALELALRALDVGNGDKVAVVANAAMYGTTAAAACGAEPVFVDVLTDEATMDPGALRVALEQHRLTAVIVTHLYGRLARIHEITEICTRAGVSLIEDCAQAHGAADTSGRRAGSFGQLATFSFYPTKNLGAIGDGGAVVCSEPALAGKLGQLRQYGWSQKYTNALAGGRNSRLDEIQASMLLHMLPLLDEWNERRRNISNEYARRIRNERIAINPVAGQEYVGHLYVVRADDRNALQEHLKAAGVQSEVHYPIPDHRQPCHDGRYSGVSLPCTERLCETVLTLPCFPEMEKAEVERVIDACNRF